MKEFKFIIKDEAGIHARPAGLLVKAAGEFSCAIKIEKDGKSADAKRIFGLMGLGAKCGDTLTVICDGADEEAAVVALEKFMNENM